MSALELIYHRAWRDPRWTRWVKTELPCCVTGGPADDPHHVKIPILGGAKAGVDDCFVIPLNRLDHSKFDDMGRSAWEAQHGDQRDHVIKTLQIGFRAGVLGWVG